MPLVGHSTLQWERHNLEKRTHVAAGYSNDDVVVVVTGGSGGESGLLASRFAVTAAASSYVFRKRRTNVLDGWMDGWMDGG